ncbi:MAG: sigma-70 family RNA polymerase sigma factor [Oscillospiraceae bacterium]|nr:sigma-70 family RNA polymerase sigma factor [Oscillospiraceae bacterium]
MNNDNEMYLEELVTKYNDYLLKVITNTNTKISNEDIEEIVADTFFILWKNINRIEEIESIKAYISVIAKNLLKNKYRKTVITYDISDYENAIADSLGLDALIEQKEREELLEKGLNEFAREDIAIFTEFYYSSKKVKEIARELEISESKVKVKLHRMRKKLKKLLKEGGAS